MRANVDEFAHFDANGLIEVQEILPLFLEERFDIILKVVEEGRISIGTLQSVPVQMSPIAMITDTDILDKWRFPTDYRHGQCLNTLSRSDETAVPVGLLLETLPLLYFHMFGPIQFLISLYRAEIGCTQQDVLHEANQL